jgi:hypothetical protein
MPKNKSAKHARLGNIAKAIQKRHHNINEISQGAWYSLMPADTSSVAAETPNGNEATPLPPIPSPDRSMDLGDEGGQAIHNKELPHDAQEQAVPTEHTRKHACMPHYPGQSERTISRKKMAHRKLLTQGFTTLPEFFRQKAEKDKQKARLDALVAAAAAQPRPNPQTAKEKETEGSEIVEMTPEAWAEECNSKIASELHDRKRTTETTATNGVVQPCGLDRVTTSRVVEVAPEPIPVEDAAGDQSEDSEPSGMMPGLGCLERARARCIRGLSSSGSCWKAPPMTLDESEESTETLSDDNELDNEPDSDKVSESECRPSETTRRKFNDIQVILARKLEALRHGNDPDEAGLEFALDNTMERLRDFAALTGARDNLTVMVEDRKMKKDLVLHGRVQAMVGVLNLFLDEALGYTWRQASLIVAKSQSGGVARARLMRHWILNFLQNNELPRPKHIGTRPTVLEDEDIAQEIQSRLGEKMKSGLIKATDLVDIVASPHMQEQLTHAGIEKPTISERTARRWLGRMGFRYGKQKNGMYIDGHERDDVVQYRNAFVQRFKQYERRFHLWDDNGEELPPPRGFPVPEAAGRFRLILVTHDESTFFQNDQRKVCWDREGSSKTPRPKGDGQSLMISDFLTADWGRLRDDDRCAVSSLYAHTPTSYLLSEARITFKPGKSRDGWFSASDLLAQVDHAIDIFEGITKGWAQGLFLFDNAPGHQKRADDAISARRMVKGAPRARAFYHHELLDSYSF